MLSNSTEIVQGLFAMLVDHPAFAARRVLVRVLGFGLGDLGADLFHVERLGLLQDALQGLGRQHAGLGEDADLLAEDHQGRNGLDAQHRRH